VDPPPGCDDAESVAATAIVTRDDFSMCFI
jgi:hypothetical protein